MKKIAYCLISDGIGGAENIVLQTLTHFNNNENFYLVINNELANDFKDVLPINRILNIGDIYIHKKYKFFRYVLNNRFYNFRRLLIQRKVSSVRKYLLVNDIELVHTHLDYALYLALQIKQSYIPQLKVFFTVHSAFGFLKNKEFKPSLILKYINFAKVDSFIFVSKYVYDIYKSEVPINDYQIIYNGIDSSQILKTKREYKNGDCFNILYLGGDKFVKGYDILVDTIDILVSTQKATNINVFILGSVTINGELYRLIENKKLQPYVEIVGFLKSVELINYFNKSHILFMPSRTEAMPLAAIEAVYNNLPIVATDIGGIPEIVSSNHNGYCTDLVPAHFAQKILSIMLTYNAFIINAEIYNESIKHDFSLELMCEKLLGYYEHFELTE